MAFIIDPISPVAFSVFGMPIRWYALAYILAFVGGFGLLKRLSQSDKSEIYLSKNQLDSLFTYLILGVILGGRLGYVLFYNLHFYVLHPLEIFAVWHGGMSFHGGILGVALATFMFICKQHFSDKSIVHNFFKVTDLLAVVAPIGLFFGRIANFINMEVMGRPTTSPIGIIFNGDPSGVARHASPLYEALLEGIVLFIIMFVLYLKTNLRKKHGALSGILCITYAIFRIFCEQFRAPDIQIGFLTSWGLTMGQLLSGIMFVIGGGMLVLSLLSKEVK